MWMVVLYFLGYFYRNKQNSYAALNVVLGSKCYKTLMYPVNVYLFTPAVTLQTHCTCGPIRRAHTEKWPWKPRRSTTLANQKHQKHPSSKLIFEARRGILLALKWHKYNSWISHLQTPITKELQVGIVGHL